MKLYTYFRSSAAYRVRIALNLKGLDYESIPVHLVKNGGEQKSPEYLAKNPQGLVPLFETDSAETISQSLAIIEYLEEIHPEPALLPSDALERARVRALALAVAADLHPLNNLRVLQRLSNELQVTDEQKSQWYQHWVKQGFTALEAMLTEANGTGDFCHGNQPSIADCCLIPQVYNAERFKCQMDDYPTIQRITENCLALDAFQKAVPENQADAA